MRPTRQLEASQPILFLDGTDPGTQKKCRRSRRLAEAEALFERGRLLARHDYRPIPVNPAFEEIEGLPCFANLTAIGEPVDTVTLYLRPARSTPLIDEILNINPRRIIMNPGAENEALAEAASGAGIEVVEGCTLVMLRTGLF